jgi:hypothetical protein
MMCDQTFPDWLQSGTTALTGFPSTSAGLFAVNLKTVG